MDLGSVLAALVLWATVVLLELAYILSTCRRRKVG